MACVGEEGKINKFHTTGLHYGHPWMPGFAHLEVVTDTDKSWGEAGLEGSSEIRLCQHIFQKHNWSKEKIQTAGKKKAFVILQWYNLTLCSLMRSQNYLMFVIQKSIPQLNYYIYPVTKMQRKPSKHFLLNRQFNKIELVAFELVAFSLYVYIKSYVMKLTWGF